MIGTMLKQLFEMCLGVMTWKWFHLKFKESILNFELVIEAVPFQFLLKISAVSI